MKDQLWFLYDFPYPHGAIIHASCHWPFPTKAINGWHTVLVTEPEGRRGRGWERESRAEEKDGRRRERGEGRVNRRWVMEENEKEDGDSKKDERERRERRNWKWGQRIQAFTIFVPITLKTVSLWDKTTNLSCNNLQCLHISHFIHVPQFHCPVKGAAEQLMCTPPKCQTLQ